MSSDPLRTLREIAAAQSRIAAELVAHLRAQKPWQEALRAAARGRGIRGWLQGWRSGKRRSPHALLTDQLGALQRQARELALWLERIAAEVRGLDAERERLLGAEEQLLQAHGAISALAAARNREVAALYAQMDALPTRLDPRYALLEANVKALVDQGRGGDDAEAARVELMQALRANRELHGALKRADQVMRRLEAAALAGVDRVDRALTANAAAAGARGLSRAVAVAVQEHDPDSVEQLARETEQFLAECAQRLPSTLRGR